MIPRFSQTLDDTKARLDGRELTEAILGHPVSRGSTWWLFRAPGRADRHPSFGVRPTGFKDFATGESGDLFALLMLLYGLPTRTDAIRYAIDLAGGAIFNAPPRPRPHLAQPDTSSPPPTYWQSIAKTLVEEAEAYLWSDHAEAKAVRQYLFTVRKLTAIQLQRFHVGFNPRWKQSAWIKPDGRYASLPPGIVIPCFADNHLWYVKVRCIVGNLATALHRTPEHIKDANSPKYLNLYGGNTSALFNADTLNAQQPALFTEGEFDAMLADQLCGTQVSVVTIGAASNRLSAHFMPKLAQIPHILLCLDTDAAGAVGVERLRQVLSTPTTQITVPHGKDIGEYVGEHGGDLAAFLTPALATDPAAHTTPLPVSSPIPDTWRAALNRYVHPAIAPTLEVWQEAVQAGLFTPTAPTTLAQLIVAGQTLGRHVSEHTLKTGLRLGTAHFWRVLHPSDSIQNLSEDTLCKTHRNPMASGRKATQYVLLSPSEQGTYLLALAAPRLLEKYFPLEEQAIAPLQPAFLEALGFTSEEAKKFSHHLSLKYSDVLTRQPDLQVRLDRARLDYKRLEHDLKKPHSTPLPAGWTYRNAAEYAACFVRALAEANPHMQHSRKQLARSLGRGERGVDAVLKRAGIANERQEVERPIRSVAEFEQLDRAFDPSLKGYPVKIVSIRSETKTSASRRFDPCEKGFVRHELACGSQVVVKYQQASRQVVVSTAQPMPPARQQRSETVEKPAESTQRKTAKPRSPFFGASYDPEWCEAWLLKLMNTATSWQCLDDVLLNRKTGEIVTYSLPMALSLLLCPDADMPEAVRLSVPRMLLSDDLFAGLLASEGVLQEVRLHDSI